MKKSKVAYWGLALGAVMLSAISAPGGALGFGVAPLMNGSPGLVLQSQSNVAPGMVRASWTFPGGSVNAVDMTGSTVSAGCTGQSGAAGSCWASTGPSSQPSIARYYTQAQAAQLTYDELGALGASNTVALSMASNVLPQGIPFTPSSTPPSGTVTNSLASTSSSGTLTSLSIPVGSYFHSACTQVTGDAGNASIYACINQRLLQDNSSGTYVGDTKLHHPHPIMTGLTR